MHDDPEAAAKLSRAVREANALLHPATMQSTGGKTAPFATPISSSPQVKRFCSIVFIVAAVNFVAFLIGTAALGGDAVNGKVKGGRYYVSNHGKLTEVSKAAFTYSRFHVYTLFVTHPMAILCALLSYSPRRSRRT
jgi:hypothetical protein